MSKLFIEDRLKALLPGWLYYPYKIAQEIRRSEPELAILRELARPGCTAVDVGANRGFYSYALAAIAGRVEAFEPNPAMAAFARGKARRNVRVHEVALSNREGTAPFYIPLTRDGTQAHLLGNLGNIHPANISDVIEVRLAALDSFDFSDVGFIKIDVEGAEFEVMQGAQRTIARDRPNLIIELLTQPDEEALAAIGRIEREFGYHAFVMHEGKRQDARTAITHSRGTVRTKNVVLLPK
jgi:FkbM family methyltransferase